MNAPVIQRAVPLGDLTEIIMGQAPPGSECNKSGNGEAFVKAGEFSDREPIIREWTTRPLKLAKRGDVLVCVVGATAGKINLGINCAIGRSVAAVRPTGQVLDTNYLHHFLQTRVDHLRAGSQGLAQGVITREMLASLPIPVPPLDEQQRIAAILDKADALRRKRRRAVGLLDSLMRSIFLEMFGNPLTNLSSWQTRPLKGLGNVQTGKTPPTADPANFGEDLPFITPGDLERGGKPSRFISHAGAKYSKTVDPGAALVCCIGATIGKMDIATQGVAFNQQINAVQWGPDIDPEFGLAALRFYKTEIINRALSTTLPILKKSEFEKVEIVVPPISLQTEFASRLEMSKNIRAKLISDEHQMDVLFSSLQHRAFSGQL